MKRALIPVLLAFSLAGCATTPGNIGSASGVKDIQAAAVAICKFLPAATFVTDLLLSGNIIASSATSIAAKICDAVTINPLADGPGAKNYVPHVNGIRVQGRFVK